MADAGDDDAVGIGDQHLAAGRARPGRHHALELGLQPALEPVARLRPLQPLEPIGEQIGAAFDLLDDLADRLATMIEHLHDRADADGEQKRDDERRDRTPQSRLGGEQPPIGGLGDRLRQSFDGIGTHRRARDLGARHGSPPFGFLNTFIGRMCRISPNHF